MEKGTVKAVLIQRGPNTFDVELHDTTGRTRDLIIGGQTFKTLIGAELFIRRSLNENDSRLETATIDNRDLRGTSDAID